MRVICVHSNERRVVNFTYYWKDEEDEKDEKDGKDEDEGDCMCLARAVLTVEQLL